MVANLRRNRVQKSESGFTLVELLVVVLIIGVLSAIAIPAFSNQRIKANNAALESDMRNVAMAFDTFLTTSEGVEYATTPSMYHPQTGGWAAAFMGTHPDVWFVGDSRMKQTYAPAGMANVTVSEGSGIGVVSAVNTQREPGTYCIVGSYVNSDYEAISGVDRWNTALYYDSLMGGLYSSDDLPPNGACHYYYTRFTN